MAYYNDPGSWAAAAAAYYPSGGWANSVPNAPGAYLPGRTYSPTYGQYGSAYPPLTIQPVNTGQPVYTAQPAQAASTADMPQWTNRLAMPAFTPPGTVTGVNWDMPTWMNYNAQQQQGAVSMNEMLRQWAALAAQVSQAQAEYNQHQYEFSQTFPWQQQTDTWANELANRNADITREANLWGYQLGNKNADITSQNYQNQYELGKGQLGLSERQQAWQEQWLPQQQQNELKARQNEAALQAWGRMSRPNVRYV